jgi:CheY-like chemotaxis protein/HAMP domain-containing protein
VTFQRKLLLGTSLMILPVLLIGLEAIRSNAEERRALETLGAGLGRNRTYAELETAMFNQTESVWRYLTGMDSSARNEFRMAGEVVDYWYDRWQGELKPDEMELAKSVQAIQVQIQAVGDSVFRLYDSGHHELAYQTAQLELKGRLQPALTTLNREIYRRAREFSVQAAFARVEEIVDNERRVLLAITGLALAGGLLISWLIARGLIRPITDLSNAMTVVGGGDLDHPIRTQSSDEIGALARSFAGMTENLRKSRAEMVRLNGALIQSEKLASLGEMAAAVAHAFLSEPLELAASAHRVASPSRPPRGAALRYHPGGRPPGPADQSPARFSRPGAVSSDAGADSAAGAGHPPAFTERLRAQGVTLEQDLRRRSPRSGGSDETGAGTRWNSFPTLSMPCHPAAALPSRGDWSIRRDARARRDGTDTGSGIPEQVLRFIGEPFLPRARRYRPRRGHCGGSWAARRPSRSDQPSRRRNHRDDLAAPMNGSTVLIVDDERNLARAMKAFLAEHGYESEVAGDAERALQLLPTLHPDVVFSDVRLPGMNGIELLKRIKEFDPAIPVVIMTAFGSIEGAVAAVKLGAFDYVKKPLDLEELKSWPTGREALAHEQELLPAAAGRAAP